MEFDIYDKHDIGMNFVRIKKIFDTEIFMPDNFVKNPFLSAAITGVIVCLSDLLQKSKKAGLRVAFTDDVLITNEVNDITDLISKVRNVPRWRL